MACSNVPKPGGLLIGYNEKETSYEEVSTVLCRFAVRISLFVCLVRAGLGSMIPWGQLNAASKVSLVTKEISWFDSNRHYLAVVKRTVTSLLMTWTGFESQR